MMRTEILERHLSFLDELDSAIDQALSCFSEVEPDDIRELEQMKRKVTDVKESVCRAIETENAAGNEAESESGIAAGA